MGKASISMQNEKLMSGALINALDKIGNTPLANNKTACMIRGVIKEVRKHQEAIRDAYKKEILEAFAKKNDKGELFHPDNNPEAYDVDETRIEEFKKVQEEFGKRNVTLTYGPLRPAHLEGIMLSANEIDALGDLFVEDDGPGLSVVG